MGSALERTALNQVNDAWGFTGPVLRLARSVSSDGSCVSGVVPSWTELVYVVGTDLLAAWVQKRVPLLFPMLLPACKFPPLTKTISRSYID